MVTLETADNALKSFYLDAVTEALDTKTNAFLSKIEKSTTNVVGKDVKKLVKIGLNGGIGAGSETGALPSASPNDYVQLTATLKNLYGTIEISDKALRASANNEGAFVNLLNDEMQSLIKSANFNFGRMLFGDGTGYVSSVVAVGSDNKITVKSVNGIAEGMVLDFYSAAGEPLSVKGRKVLRVDREEKAVYVDGDGLNTTVLPLNSGAYIQSSFGYEITGLQAIFDEEKELYGVSRNCSLMKPYRKDDAGDIDENMIQKAIDTIEQDSGSKVNCIICSWGVRRALAEYFRSFKTIMPTMEFAGGFTAMSFNGIPVIADKFCPEGSMYLLNTDDFKLHQLCDWQWLQGEDGKILKQVPGKPVYTATLVKYAELMCERPCGQGLISGITEA